MMKIYTKKDLAVIGVLTFGLLASGLLSRIPTLWLTYYGLHFLFAALPFGFLFGWALKQVPKPGALFFAVLLYALPLAPLSPVMFFYNVLAALCAEGVAYLAPRRRIHRGVAATATYFLTGWFWSMVGGMLLRGRDLAYVMPSPMLTALAILATLSLALWGYRVGAGEPAPKVPHPPQQKHHEPPAKPPRR